MIKNQTSNMLVNGALVDQILVNDRGLQYGDGVFETIKLIQGKPLLWPAHLARLEQGCNRLGIPFDGLFDRIATDVGKILAGSLWSVAILKLVVTRGAGERGYKPNKEASPTLIVSLSDYLPNESWSQDGVEVRFCRTALGINPLLSGIKHLNRLEQVLARSEWGDSTIAEGIMLDIEGNLIEGTMSNLFWVHDHSLFTPELDRCGIVGTVRQQLIKLAGQSGIPVVEGRFSSEVLKQAEEVFVCNSAIDICPVIKLAETEWPIGPITRQMQAQLKEVYAC